MVTAGGIAIEAISDRQLHAFNESKQPGEIMARGLWAYSRHPNYFGEVSFWWGLFLFGLASSPQHIWPIAGALAILALFVLGSIPMLDRRSVTRRPEYAEHMKRVSALVPWFRRS